jgi:hypothetical protein
LRRFIVTDQGDADLFISLKAFFDYRISALREYVDLQILGLSKHLESQARAHDDARSLAAENLDSRLAKLNELREQVTTDGNKYATKTETYLRFDSVEKDLRQLLLSRAEMQGKASQNAVIFAWAIGSAGLITAVISLLLRFMSK